MVALSFFKRQLFLSLNVLIVFVGIIFLYVRFYESQKIFLSNITREIKRVFSENEGLLIYMGSLISKSNYDDLDSILYILKDVNKLNYSSMTSSYVSWADSTGKILVSGKSGIIKDDFKNISFRDYYLEAKNDPWELKFSKIDKSINSNKIVIPTIIGITTKNKFLGFLVFGLNHDEIIKSINISTNNEFFDYCVYSKDNIILNSMNFDMENFSINNLEKDMYFSLHKLNFLNKNNCEIIVFITQNNLFIWIINEIIFFILFYVVFLSLFYFRNKINLLYNDFFLILSNKNNNIDNYKQSYLFNGLLYNLCVYKKSVENDLLLLETMGINFKHLTCSLKEKDDYFYKFRNNLNHSLNCIIEMIENSVDINNIENLSDCVGNLRRIKDHDWIYNQETVFNICSVIEECINYNMNSIIDMGLVIRKNIKNIDMFVKADRDSIKNKLISIISFCISASSKNGEIHIRSQAGKNRTGNVVSISIIYRTAINIDSVSKDINLYSDVIKNYNEFIVSIIDYNKCFEDKKIKFTHEKVDKNNNKFTIELNEINVDNKNNVILFNLRNR